MAEQFSVKINHVDISLFTGDLLVFEVDTHVFLPSMFTLLIKDKILDPFSGALEYTDNQLLFKVGAPVTISVTTTDVPGALLPVTNTLIDGEITAIEPVFNEDGGVNLRVRGFDLAHRLTIGKKSRTFGDGNPLMATTTEMQIISKIASSAGLVPKVDMSGLSSLRYHYVMQYNQSDWDFLWSRAQLLGYQVYVDGRTLNFQKAGATRNNMLKSPGNLNWGTNLRRFEPRIVSMGQVNSASAYGWDPKSKKAITSKSKSHSSKTAASIKELAYGSKSLTLGYFITDSEDIVMNPVVRESAEAKAFAAARFAEHESQFVRASGELNIGDPRLVAGTEVTIEDVGVRFGGKYYITRATHLFRHGQYSVKFEVSGRDPYTIRQLLLGNENSTDNIPGLVIGVVTDINDPEKLGRVKVKYPWMPKDGGSELGSNWARLASPGAGKNRGIFFTPEIDDEVLILFEQGDVNYPYVVGALWNSKDKPPEGQGEIVGGGKTTNQRVMRSRSGHVIIMDDTKGAEKVIFEDKSKKNSIIFDTKAKSVTIKSEGDMTLEAGGKFIMTSKQDFSLDSKAKIAFSASTNLNLEAKSGLSAKSGSSEMSLAATGAALKGTKVDIQGQAQTAIQGAQTSVKGSAMVEIQGALVKIN
jgi:phage protein D/phage baseplate assembly protein gpV